MRLLSLLVAFCVAELVHNCIEIWGMRQKVTWLEAAQAGRDHRGWPVNIDTKLKTVILHGAILALVGGLSWLVLRVAVDSERTLILIGIGVLALNYCYTTAKVDQFHSAIGALIRKAKGL